jgi:acyl-CoA thioester hydrolase
VSRIKLIMPENFEFSTKIDVRITDINYGNHLGNDSLLSLIHESRVRYLQNIGLSELDAGGCGIIMVDSVIIYTSEIQYGDKLIFNVSVDEFTDTGCDFYYKIISEKNSKDAAAAKTGIVFFDYSKKKVSHVPEIFKEKVLHLKNN